MDRRFDMFVDLEQVLSISNQLDLPSTPLSIIFASCKRKWNTTYENGKYTVEDSMKASLSGLVGDANVIIWPEYNLGVNYLTLFFHHSLPLLQFLRKATAEDIKTCLLGDSSAEVEVCFDFTHHNEGTGRKLAGLWVGNFPSIEKEEDFEDVVEEKTIKEAKAAKERNLRYDFSKLCSEQGLGLLQYQIVLDSKRGEMMLVRGINGREMEEHRRVLEAIQERLKSAVEIAGGPRRLIASLISEQQKKHWIQRFPMPLTEEEKNLRRETEAALANEEESDKTVEPTVEEESENVPQAVEGVVGQEEQELRPEDDLSVETMEGHYLGGGEEFEDDGEASVMQEGDEISSTDSSKDEPSPPLDDYDSPPSIDEEKENEENEELDFDDDNDYEMGAADYDENEAQVEVEELRPDDDQLVESMGDLDVGFEANGQDGERMQRDQAKVDKFADLNSMYDDDELIDSNYFAREQPASFSRYEEQMEEDEAGIPFDVAARLRADTLFLGLAYDDDEEDDEGEDEHEEQERADVHNKVSPSDGSGEKEEGEGDQRREAKQQERKEENIKERLRKRNSDLYNDEVEKKRTMKENEIRDVAARIAAGRQKKQSDEDPVIGYDEEDIIQTMRRWEEANPIADNRNGEPRSILKKNRPSNTLNGPQPPREISWAKCIEKRIEKRGGEVTEVERQYFLPMKGQIFDN